MTKNKNEGPKQIGDTLDAALARLGESLRQRRAEPAAKQDTPVTKPTKPNMRQPPEGDDQPDMFVPALYDAPAKDGRSIMDVAVFRLSKKDKRASQIIRHELPNGYVEVESGARGMASVWDYDIVLMMVSHLTEAMNRHRQGRGPIPSRKFHPHVSEILKFCRRSDGGKQYQEVESALDRLKTTQLKIVRTEKGRDGRPRRIAGTPEGLISGGEVVSYADNGRVLSVMIEAPQWLYKEITESQNPNVLTVHPDYFLIEPGIGRFVYRLARRAAGESAARWSFQRLYERSASTGPFKKFTYMVRKLIEANDLPEYALAEEDGQEGPILVMTHRAATLPSASPGS